jgi:anti-sigma factor RsiW
MKTTEFTLDLQAYVDGELDASHRAEVERVLASDAEARALVEGLRQLSELVRTLEPLARVPESREFYWSQIQRRIAAAEVAEGREARPASGALNWLRWLAPALGVAAVAVFVVLPRPSAETTTLASNGPVEDAVSMTFRSDADGVTIHWIN